MDQEITQKIIEMGNYDLGVGVILAFDLPAGKILNKVVAQLIKNTEYTAVKQLIERMKVLM